MKRLIDYQTFYYHNQFHAAWCIICKRLIGTQSSLGHLIDNHGLKTDGHRNIEYNTRTLRV